MLIYTTCPCGRHNLEVEIDLEDDRIELDDLESKLKLRCECGQEIHIIFDEWVEEVGSWHT